MNYEQILIKLGVDATAVSVGLGRVGNTVKAWGASLIHDMKGSLFRLFAAGFVADKVIEGLSEVKRKILEIHRAQEDLGGGQITNFIQGLFNMSERLGISYEGLSSPLLKFKKTLDAARLDPQGIQAQNLIRFGIVTNIADLKTQSFVKSLGKLSDAYLKSGKNIKLLTDMGMRIGGNFPAFQNLMSLGGQKIEAMNDNNFFTKLTPQTIEQFTAFYAGAKSAGQTLVATLGNVVGFTLAHNPITQFGRLAGQLAGDPSRSMTHPLELLKNVWNGIEDAQEKQNEKMADTIQMEQQRVEANTKLRELLFNQVELQDTIADRDKLSVDEMSAMGRKLSGDIDPMELFRTVTPRMKTALGIKDLEQNARIQFLKGNDRGSQGLQAEADRIRAANPWMKRLDVDPMQNTNYRLDQIKDELEPVSDMAKFVNQQNKQP